jgi:nucleotide-binding universal stress UspA family protein
MGDVLIGIDGSARSADALALGRLLAATLRAEPVLLHAHPYGPLESLLAEDEHAGILRRVAETAAGQTGEHLAGTVPPRLTLVAEDSPAAALQRAAETSEAAAIVVGSSHRGVVGRVLPGGVPQRLLSGAPCPVAVAPVGYAAAAPAAIGTVGCGFDGSPTAREALRFAGALAEAGAGALRVIAVHCPVAFGSVPVTAEQAFTTVNRQLRADLAETLRRALETAPPGTAAALLDGDPAEALARESEDLGILVLGSRGYGPLGSVLLGSVAQRLVCTAACPVVVVPRGAAEDARSG